MKLDRRAFLRGVAAVLGIGALPVAAKASTVKELQYPALGENSANWSVGWDVAFSGRSYWSWGYADIETGSYTEVESGYTEPGGRRVTEWKNPNFA